MTKQEKLEEIANHKLNLHHLEARNNDDLDFSEHACWDIKAALEAAYEAGRASK